MKISSRLLKRIAGIVVVLVLLTLAALYAILRPALQVGAGVVAHQLCSQTFVSGLPPQLTYEEELPNLVGPALRHAHYDVDSKAGTVQATLLGGHARAVYTKGWGCRLDFGEPMQALSPRAEAVPVTDEMAPAQAVPPASPRLTAAFDEEFADAAGVTPRQVKAVVIVKDGKVVAERYAEHYGVNTPVMSFSVAKSFTNALLGILVRQGRLDMNKPAAIKEWQGANDPRAKLRPDDLLRMASGLDAAENDSGLAPASQMFYNSNDMAGYGAGRQLKEAPETEWEYTSVNTLLLDRIIGDTIGGGPQGVRDFAEHELFAPLGMTSVTMEFDGAGTFLGASHFYATPRDYARFGQLYLNDGVTKEGQRILPEGWVAYSRKSTLGSSYGAGFWTNDGPSQFAANRVAQGFPKDGYFASGNEGQRIYIIPSEHMVMVRFGYSKGPDFGIQGDLRLMKTAIDETRNSKG